MSAPTRGPQITVITGGPKGFGTRVQVNGVDIQNVESVSVTNEMVADDYTRSTLVLKLIGEEIEVRPKAE